MVLDREGIEDILKRVDEYVQQTRDAMQEAMKGRPLGVVTATDEEMAALFEQKALENPNFVLALPYVEGGLELLAQYERTRGLRGS